MENTKNLLHNGAKKYAYIDKKYNQIHITVAGVPKCGAKALNSLSEFKDNLVFKYEDTNKNLIMYVDEMEEFNLTDHKGNTETVYDKFGCCLLPTTYVLGKSIEYADLLTDESSARSIYIEGDEKIE